MKKKIAIEMTETWWDAVLMAIVDALDTREVHSVECVCTNEYINFAIA